MKKKFICFYSNGKDNKKGIQRNHKTKKSAARSASKKVFYRPTAVHVNLVHSTELLIGLGLFGVRLRF